MISELLLAAQSVQSLTTLLKAAKGLSNYNEIVAAVAEVNIKLMQANAVALASQEKQSALATKIQELEKECDRLKDWQTEKERYELKEIAPGVFARIEKGLVGNLQSAHKFCATCFEQNFKGPLQQEKIDVGRKLSLTCHRCKSKVIFDSYLKTSDQSELKLEPNTEQILKQFFDAGSDLSVNDISPAIPLKIGVVQYHFDILLKKNLIAQATGYEPIKYSLTEKGRAYVIENMNS